MRQKIIMIVENSFPFDPRVRKEVQTLKEKFDITVIALKRLKSDKLYEILDGVRIFRIPELPSFKFSKLRYILQYAYFTILSTLIFFISHIFNGYKSVHVHNPPDTLFIAGLAGKLLGVKFIFDHHDLSPELYLARFAGRRDIIYKILVFCERLSCKLADSVIDTNESFKKITMERHGIPNNKIFVVRNNPILSECYTQQVNFTDKAKGDKKELLFLGGINPQDGPEMLVRILYFLVNDLKETNFVCNIVGAGDAFNFLKNMVSKYKLSDYVDCKGFVTDRGKIKEYLLSADVCIEPAPENELNNSSTFIKIMEYMAACKPIVAFDLLETRYSANGSAILVEPGDVKGFANAIKQLLESHELRKKLGMTGYERVTSELTWENASLNLIKAYEYLALK